MCMDTPITDSESLGEEPLSFMPINEMAYHKIDESDDEQNA